MARPGAEGAVVVTGASSGIGRACVLHLARHGFEVFAAVRREEDAAALREIQGIQTLRLDLKEPASVEAAAGELKARLGSRGLRGLVNNAGVAVAGPLELLPPETLREQLEVNVVGQVAVTQALLPLLRRSRGRIVFMSSVSGRVALPFLGAYAASKFALEAVVDALRVELEPWGIDVVSVQPGPVATPIWGKSVSASDALVSRLGAAAEPYAARMAATRESAERAGQGGAVAPEEVALVVHRALTERGPRTRYLVGPFTRPLAALLALAPDRVRDWAIRKSRFRGAGSQARGQAS